MKKRGLNELRELYLKFFESKGHLRLPSFSLVPQGDKSLLLINSGMAPMKKYFTGELTPPKNRVTTCQKCIRTPDIENVGKTARHGTYFEMLGNFSFGDYFKKEAIEWAWEFFIDVVKLPKENLWISIYLEDDEAFDIWTKHIGLPEERVVRMGKEDNFWEHGAGPCGPSSEIHYDRGIETGCTQDCKLGCECDRYVELWNLVFTQFESDGKGTYTKLEYPNIDTGMGLERLAAVLQNVSNIFEVDTMQDIMTHISKISNVKYHTNEDSDVSFRVITDHIRSSTFMVSDGVMPSNEGRGYVLRRLIRRASRHGRLLGVTTPFLAELATTVIKLNKEAYPNLEEKREFILKVIENEEDNFSHTIDNGLELLGDMLKNVNNRILSGEDIFKLYDTFGFPIDLTKEIADEQNIRIDENKFTKLMTQQRDRARKARAESGAEGWYASEEFARQLPETQFVGYDTLTANSKVIALVDNNKSVDEVSKKGAKFILVTEKSPFYAQSGGQEGDSGEIRSKNLQITVVDTTKTDNNVFLHHCSLVAGRVKTGDTLELDVDKSKRMATMRNHTSAHLIQAALREVLGEHVEQAGQMVSDKEMRFDFTHFSALTMEERQQIESLVNEKILEALPVITEIMTLKEARKKGAMALFGEKYGDHVRVINVPNFSSELCGGTHVDNTAKIGMIKIISETSVASGVRRMVCITGENVLDLMHEQENLLVKTAELLKLTNYTDIVKRSKQLVRELRGVEDERNNLLRKLALESAKNLFDHTHNVGDIYVVTGKLKNVSPDALRNISDKAKSFKKPLVAVVASRQEEGNVSFSVAASQSAIDKGIHAGNLVREIAKLAGGSGGGRPDSAMAGAKDSTKLDIAFTSIDQIISDMIKE